MIEQNEQGLGENVVQNVKSGRKTRSSEEKIGRIKYNQVLLKEVLSEIREIKGDIRVMRNALGSAGFMHFSATEVARFAFGDKVDEAIADLVRESGDNGVFPKDVATGLLLFLVCLRLLLVMFLLVRLTFQVIRLRLSQRVRAGNTIL